MDRGRRKPTALKILEGNRGRRPILPEPQPAKGVDKPPSGLPAVSKRIWKTLAAELDRLNLLTVVDAMALEGVCVAYAHAIAADREIERLQREIKSGTDEKRVKKLSAEELVVEYRTININYNRLSLQNAVSKKAWQQVKSFCTEFGLTPASRSRLAVGDTGMVIDPIAEMIG